MSEYNTNTNKQELRAITLNGETRVAYDDGWGEIWMSPEAAAAQQAVDAQFARLHSAASDIADRAWRGATGEYGHVMTSNEASNVTNSAYNQFLQAIDYQKLLFAKKHHYEPGPQQSQEGMDARRVMTARNLGLISDEQLAKAGEQYRPSDEAEPKLRTIGRKLLGVLGIHRPRRDA